MRFSERSGRSRRCFPLDELWLHQIIQELVDAGMHAVCICSGKRNAALILALDQFPDIKKYSFFEERSAAFFALGLSRATHRPVAVLTTSGTAVGECLPAAMEAYYSGVPLILWSADRPKKFRGTGAPQSVEQPGIFKSYAIYEQDLENGETCDLKNWTQRGPAHLNICLEEIQGNYIQALPKIKVRRLYRPQPLPLKKEDDLAFYRFLEKTDRLLVIVGTLREDERLSVEDFLAGLGAPVYLEAPSGLRESPSLRSFRVHRLDHIQVEGVLRIGGVPTCRLWRDLESMEGTCDVCSISEVPFPGLSWGTMIQASLPEFLRQARFPKREPAFIPQREVLFQQFPQSEPSLIHELSKKIPSDARVYLGNSMPIREWDLAAHDSAPSDIWASRGVNGIDGQLSTFFGLCDPHKENWTILGDLTALYDMTAPWILSSMEQVKITIVVINNSGGMIFKRVGLDHRFTNPHGLNFEHFAKMWNLDYMGEGNHRLLEYIPDKQQTEDFWKCLKNLPSTVS